MLSPGSVSQRNTFPFQKPLHLPLQEEGLKENRGSQSSLASPGMAEMKTQVPLSPQNSQHTEKVRVESGLR